MRESLVVIDKPPGPTSFDVVKQVKHRVVNTKVGHTGSLDPFASGVLILLLGKATKLSQVLLNADKSYRATVRLGEATDTMDRTGKVTETVAVPKLDFDKVREVVKSFEGIWHQTPPMYSAKKIRGVRLYRLARENIRVRRTPIPVHLYRVEALAYSEPDIEIDVYCSKGTYVRSLADEIGRRLGTVGYLQDLRRLSCGDFSLDESVKFDALFEDFDGWMEKGYEKYRNFVRKERHLQKLPRDDNKSVL